MTYRDDPNLRRLLDLLKSRVLRSALGRIQIRMKFASEQHAARDAGDGRVEQFSVQEIDKVYEELRARMQGNDASTDRSAADAFCANAVSKDPSGSQIKPSLSGASFLRLGMRFGR